MAFADRDAVKSIHVAASKERFWFGAEVVSHVFPVVAALVIGAKSAAGIIAAMDHAVFATRIARDAVDHAVFVPVNFFEHLLVTTVMTVRHQVAGGFPAFDVARRDCPGGAGEFAFAGEKFLINGRAKNGE